MKPLFREDAIAREVMAVDSEDSKNRILDGRRSLQIMKDLLVDTLQYKKFSTGNANTLAYGKPEENASQLARLMQLFHELHYTPDKM